MAKDEEIVDAGRLGEIRKRLGKNLPESWELTTLGDAFKWGSGGTPKRTDPRFYGGDIPWLIIGDLNDGVVSDSETTITEDGLKESSAKWVEPGSVLLAMYGSIGKLGIAGRRLTTNQAIAFTKPDPVDAKYLFYYLTYTRGDLASLGKGATQKNISQTVIKAFPFVLSPPDQQKRIVAEIEKQFSRLDEAVANLKRYKAAVLKAAVEGRLVETEADLARREGRSYETGEQLLQRILETRRSQWQGKGKYKEPAAPDTTDLPELPEGWVWASYEQVGRLRLGRQRAPRYHTGPNMRPYLRVQNVFEDRIDLSDVMEMDFPPGDFEKYQLAPGDLLLNEGQSPELLGRPAIYRGELAGACFTNTLIRFRSVEGVSVEFALLVSRHNMHAGRFVDEGTITTNIAHLSLGRLEAVEFPLPPQSEQHRIVAEVDRRLSIVRETEAQVDANLQRAERLRQSILSKAFSA